MYRVLIYNNKLGGDKLPQYFFWVNKFYSIYNMDCCQEPISEYIDIDYD